MPVKDYRIVLASTALTFAVSGALYPILPLYVDSVSGDYFLVGLMVALPFLAAVPMSFLWGSISDWLGNRKYVVVSGTIVGGALFFAFPFADTTWLIALRCVQMAFLSSGVLLNAVVTEYFPAKKGRSIGDLNLANGVGSAVGALAAGLLLPASALVLGSEDITIFFFACGIITLLSGLVILWIMETEKKVQEVRLGKLLRFGEMRQMAIVCSVAFTLPLAGYLVFAMFPVYLKTLVLPENVTLVAGIFTAFSAISGIFAAGLAGRACDKYGRRKILIWSGLAYVLVWVGMLLTQNLVALAILWAMPVWSFFIVSSTTMVSDATKDEERGRGIGLLNTAVNMGAVTGSVVSGYIFSIGRPELVFAGAGVLAGAGALVALGSRESLKK